jgi:hypothetical protein
MPHIRQKANQKSKGEGQKSKVFRPVEHCPSTDADEHAAAAFLPFAFCPSPF